MEQDLITGTRFMGAVSLLILAFSIIFIYRGKVQSKVYNTSRYLLAWGAFALGVHNIIQFFGHFRETNVGLCWTINLMFYTLIMPAFYIGELNLLRAGHRLRIPLITSILFNVLCIILFFIGLATGTLINNEAPYLTTTCLIAIAYTVMLIPSIRLLNKEMELTHSHLNDEELNERHNALRYTVKSMKAIMACTLLTPWVGMSSSLILSTIMGIVMFSLFTWYLLQFCHYGSDMAEVIHVSDEIVEAMESASPCDEKEENHSNFEHLDPIISQWVERHEFVDPSITIDVVTHSIGISSSCLNKYLNNKYGFSYRNWMSYLRIEYAKELMRKNPNYSNQAIADLCGFTNRSSFQRTFAEQVGTTPKQWCDTNCSSNS